MYHVPLSANVGPCPQYHQQIIGLCCLQEQLNVRTIFEVEGSLLWLMQVPGNIPGLGVVRGRLLVRANKEWLL